VNTTHDFKLKNVADGDTAASQETVVAGSLTYYADTGAADAYVITPAPAITAYAAGQRFSFKATNANT
jgi:hypothetical protein